VAPLLCVMPEIDAYYCFERLYPRIEGYLFRGDEATRNKSLYGSHSALGVRSLIYALSTSTNHINVNL
jgi:hypothetical protein